MSDDDKNKQEPMTPAQIAAASQKGLDNMVAKYPPITAGQAQNAQQDLSNRQTGTFIDIFNQMAGMGQAMNNDNPFYQMSNGLANATGKNMSTPEQPYQIDKQEVVDNLPVVEPPPPAATPDNGWGNVKTDTQAIQWALDNGDISQSDADWLMRWQGEANDGNNWVDGSGGTKDWDYMSSGLTNQNKQIVDRFYNSVNGNWGGNQPQQGQPPVQPTSQPQVSPVGPAGVGVMPMPNMGQGQPPQQVGLFRGVQQPTRRGKRSTF